VFFNKIFKRTDKATLDIDPFCDYDWGYFTILSYSYNNEIFQQLLQSISRQSGYKTEFDNFAIAYLLVFPNDHEDLMNPTDSLHLVERYIGITLYLLCFGSTETLSHHYYNVIKHYSEIPLSEGATTFSSKQMFSRKIIMLIDNYSNEEAKKSENIDRDYENYLGQKFVNVIQRVVKYQNHCTPKCELQAFRKDIQEQYLKAKQDGFKALSEMSNNPIKTNSNEDKILHIYSTSYKLSKPANDQETSHSQEIPSELSQNYENQDSFNNDSIFNYHPNNQLQNISISSPDKQ
jgi:DNA-binding FadR family transcriptional regulator